MRLTSSLCKSSNVLEQWQGLGLKTEQSTEQQEQEQEQHQPHLLQAYSEHYIEQGTSRLN
jgi:hypothetical protein